MSSFNFADDLSVLTGTLYGEIRGGTRAAQENVAQVILNRQARRPEQSVAQICLAPLQFSCWNLNDPNREKILNASRVDPNNWARLLDVAQKALAGTNPDRVGGARNYYATWMAIAPTWARPPAVVTLNDKFHIFVRGA